MFLTYLLAQFHTPVSSVSLVIAITPKAEENLRAAAMLLFYLNKSGTLFQDLFQYIISGL
jgi:hypothetical protein